MLQRKKKRNNPNIVRMAKGNNPMVDELSSILSKHSLEEVGASSNQKKELVSGVTNSSKNEKREANKPNTNNAETKVLIIMEKVNNIIEVWKGLLDDPLSSNIETIEKCFKICCAESENESVKEITKALFDTFGNIRDILSLNVTSFDHKSHHKEHDFGEMGSSLARNNNNRDAQLIAYDGFRDVNVSLTDKIPEITATVVESIQVNCADVADEAISVEQTKCDEVDEDVEYVDGDSEETSEECSGTQSEEDPNWTLSDSDNASECKVPKKIKRLPKVDFNTTKPAALGLWLSDTGPVHLNRMCHCKGSCVRNCSCKVAGVGCSIRCGCKPEKCQRWRKVRDVLEETDSSGSDTEEEYKMEKLRVKKIATTGNETLEPSTRSLRNKPTNSRK